MKVNIVMIKKVNRLLYARQVWYDIRLLYDKSIDMCKFALHSADSSRWRKLLLLMICGLFMAIMVKLDSTR